MVQIGQSVEVLWTAEIMGGINEPASDDTTTTPTSAHNDVDFVWDGHDEEGPCILCQRLCVIVLGVVAI